MRNQHVITQGVDITLHNKGFDAFCTKYENAFILLHRLYDHDIYHLRDTTIEVEEFIYDLYA